MSSDSEARDIAGEDVIDALDTAGYTIMRKDTARDLIEGVARDFRFCGLAPDELMGAIAFAKAKGWRPGRPAVDA